MNGSTAPNETLAPRALSDLFSPSAVEMGIGLAMVPQSHDGSTAIGDYQLEDDCRAEGGKARIPVTWEGTTSALCNSRRPLACFSHRVQALAQSPLQATPEAQSAEYWRVGARYCHRHRPTSYGRSARGPDRSGRYPGRGHHAPGGHDLDSLQTLSPADRCPSTSSGNLIFLRGVGNFALTPNSDPAQNEAGSCLIAVFI